MDQFEQLLPGIFFKQDTLAAAVAKLGDFRFVPITIFFFPFEVENPGRFEDGQRQ